MPTFLNQRNPALRVYCPDLDQFAEFRGGKLELEKTDPRYRWVAAQATRDPNIVVVEKVTQCDQCGETFTGGAAAADLGKHLKSIHFDVWLARKDAKDAEARNVELQRREGYHCDVCPFGQATFGTEEDLATHVKLLHIGTGDEQEGSADSPNAAAAADTEVPAAKPTA